MFFKRNNNQESTDIGVKQVQGKHKSETRYLVKLEDNTYIMRLFHIGEAIESKDPRYMDMDFNRAKRTQREYGGVIYEVVTDACIRQYSDDKVPSQHQYAVIGKDDTWVTMNDKIEQLINDGTLTPHVNADMATDVGLDDELIESINTLTKALSSVSQHEDNADKEHKPKIHELSNQPLVAYASDGSINYVWDSSDCEIVELLSNPNTRLAIIEDDEDETV